VLLICLLSVLLLRLSTLLDPGAAVPRIKRSAPLPLRFRHDGAFKILQVGSLFARSSPRFPRALSADTACSLARSLALSGGRHALRQRRRHALQGRGAGGRRRALLRPQHHTVPPAAHRGREARPHSLHRCVVCSPRYSCSCVLLLLRREIAISPRAISFALTLAGCRCH
jgi:hypothetical protein